jgi:hypothetical protein
MIKCSGTLPAAPSGPFGRLFRVLDSRLAAQDHLAAQPAAGRHAAQPTAAGSWPACRAAGRWLALLRSRQLARLAAQPAAGPPVRKGTRKFSPFNWGRYQPREK